MVDKTPGFYSLRLQLAGSTKPSLTLAVYLSGEAIAQHAGLVPESWVSQMVTSMVTEVNTVIPPFLGQQAASYLVLSCAEFSSQGQYVGC